MPGRVSSRERERDTQNAGGEWLTAIHKRQASQGAVVSRCYVISVRLESLGGSYLICQDLIDVVCSTLKKQNEEQNRIV